MSLALFFEVLEMDFEDGDRLMTEFILAIRNTGCFQLSKDRLVGLQLQSDKVICAHEWHEMVSYLNTANVGEKGMFLLSN